MSLEPKVGANHYSPKGDGYITSYPIPISLKINKQNSTIQGSVMEQTG